MQCFLIDVELCHKKGRSDVYGDHRPSELADLIEEFEKKKGEIKNSTN